MIAPRSTPSEYSLPGLMASVRPIRAAGHRWFNSLPVSQAIQCLTDAGIDPDRAAQVAGQRPLTGDETDALLAACAHPIGPPP